MPVADEHRRLEGRTILMSGGTRGIGLAIGLAAGRAGANVVVLARGAPGGGPAYADEPCGTLLEATGGQAIMVVGDIRSEEDVERAAALTVEAFGGIDACVNVASALCLTGTEALSTATFDLMQQVNVRGAFLLTRASIPHLRASDRAHIVTVSPPLNMSERWLGAHPGYTASKYGMTILGLGWAAELADLAIASNCLWPESMITTEGALREFGARAEERSRHPQVMGDAAVELISRPPSAVTGRTLLDVDVLGAAGITDLRAYGGGERPDLDLFVDA